LAEYIKPYHIFWRFPLKISSTCHHLDLLLFIYHYNDWYMRFQMLTFWIFYHNNIITIYFIVHSERLYMRFIFTCRLLILHFFVNPNSDHIVQVRSGASGHSTYTYIICFYKPALGHRTLWIYRWCSSKAVLTNMYCL